MTRGGVFYDLYQSPYTLQLSSSSHILYFSSKLHKDKFLADYKNYADYVNKSLSNRFKVNIDFTLLGIIVFYSKVETRGFLISKGRDYYTCLNHLKLSGVKLTSND